MATNEKEELKKKKEMERLEKEKERQEKRERKEREKKRKQEELNEKVERERETETQFQVFNVSFLDKKAGKSYKQFHEIFQKAVANKSSFKQLRG